MEIKQYNSVNYEEIADLFHDSVHAIDSAVYSEEEKEAWAPTPPDYKFWKQRLETKKPFVAVKGEVIVGFIELESNGHIDCLYVHKDHQGQGIASSLLKYALHSALDMDINELHLAASKIAKPFFTQHGFIVRQSNQVKLRGQTLVNYSMSLSLKPESLSGQIAP
jgi:putative acetyltransferase